jgi:acetoin utilization deacetylase AcuC-like enzyme
MKPKRIRMTDDLVASYELFDKMYVYDAHLATSEELEEYHTKEYIEFLEKISLNRDNSLKFDLELQKQCSSTI